MKEFLGYLIPIVSVFLSYFCGRLQSSNVQKQSIKKERYEKFYIPFITSLYTGRLDLLRYSHLSLEGRGRFFDLIFQNIQYIDEKTQSFLLDFYTAYLNMMEYESGTPGYDDAPAELDAAFAKVAGSILLESAKLSRALRLPQIGKAFCVSDWMTG